jgi:hypothetical protein
MSKPPTYEFDVIVTVRRRVHVSGPTNKETARGVLKSAIQGLGLGPFNKYGNDRHPIETIVSNDFELVDVEREQ